MCVLSHFDVVVLFHLFVSIHSFILGFTWWPVFRYLIVTVLLLLLVENNNTELYHLLLRLLQFSHYYYYNYFRLDSISIRSIIIR